MEMVAEQNHTRLKYAIKAEYALRLMVFPPSASNSALATISHISHMKRNTAARGALAR